MARPKEFDRADVLSRAMSVFWEKGYDCTSMTDLTDAMGIGRASLYDTFGSKHELYREAMDLYCREMRETLLGRLGDEGPAREVLARFLERAIDGACDDDTPSCLVLKSALATGRVDPVAAETGARFVQAMEDGFTALLERGRDTGEFPSALDPRTAARFLTTLVQGFNISASIRPDAAALRDVARHALGSLG